MEITQNGANGVNALSHVAKGSNHVQENAPIQSHNSAGETAHILANQLKADHAVKSNAQVILKLFLGRNVVAFKWCCVTD